MTAKLEDRVLDLGLNVLDTEPNYIYICGTEPTTFANIASYKLGEKSFTAGSVFGSPAAGSPSGRKVSSAAITDGTIYSTATASWWAVVNSASSALLAHGSLSAAQAVTAGNTFSLASFDITIPAY